MMNQIPKSTLSAIFRAIRTEFTKSDLYEECVKSSSVRKGPRGGIRVKCQICKKFYLPKEIEVDHIEDELGPVVPYSLYYYEMCVYEYYRRVWTLPIRTLCKEDHSIVTKEQNLKRKQVKIKNKENIK